MIDFRYPNGTGEQMKRLFQTADLFQIPAVYMLYFGGPDYRKDLTCGPQHTSTCIRCQKASVSILAGLVAELISLDPRHSAEDAFHESSPLEYLANPNIESGPIRDLHVRSLEPDLQTFLDLPQTGARHVARMIFKAVSEVRRRQFARARADLLDEGATSLFSELPRDRGHFGAPYFQHVLRGLRSSIPPYVRDVLAGHEPSGSVTQHLGGIVVVHC